MSVEEDARAFGLHFQGGWQLGLLVARNVHKRPGAGRPDNSEPVRNKVSCAQFAKMARVSERTVQLYCNTWALAAQAGYCTPADQLEPGTDDPKLLGVDLDGYEFAELWRKCYREARHTKAGNTKARAGGRKGKTAESDCQSDAEPKAEPHANQTGESDPRTHPLYGLMLAMNELSDCIKRHAPNAAIVAAAGKVVSKEHRAALRRATGVL